MSAIVIPFAVGRERVQNADGEAGGARRWRTLRDAAYDAKGLAGEATLAAMDAKTPEAVTKAKALVNTAWSALNAFVGSILPAHLFPGGDTREHACADEIGRGLLLLERALRETSQPDGAQVIPLPRPKRTRRRPTKQ